MLLTISTAGSDACNLAGINAMELLINDILKQGGKRHRLRAKAFGGASMVEGLSGIGQANCDFTLDFLAREGIDYFEHPVLAPLEPRRIGVERGLDPGLKPFRCGHAVQRIIVLQINFYRHFRTGRRPRQSIAPADDAPRRSK